MVVKARFVRLGGTGTARAAAHLRYLQRDGMTRDGGHGTLYNAGLDVADGAAFQERCDGDRHQFRFIVAPEDGAEYEDLKPLVRRLMMQAETDLATKLDWVAVDHFNTGHPHSHILVRGVDDRGHDLVIAPDYIGRGLRERAAELVNLDLGPRTDREMMIAAAREVEQERFTSIDRRLLREADDQRLVTVHHLDPAEQTRRAGRLARLARMGLAEPTGRGVFKLDPALEPMLRIMGRRGDIMATMNQSLRADARAGTPADYAIYDPAEGRALVGEILARGLSDEQADRRYLIIAGTDGHSHYVDIGAGAAIENDSAARIVRISPVVPQVRQVDRIVAEVAAARGRYSVDDHLAHDPSATERFAQALVRRLEAMRRGGAGLVREADGVWTVAGDHLEQALVFERRQAARQPVRMDVLAVQAVEILARHDGLTWLDEHIAAAAPDPSGGGFGTAVRNALAVRRQWLLDEGLASNEQGEIRYRSDMTQRLRQRELARVAARLSQELGLDYVPHGGGHIEGRLRSPVQVGASRYAVVEDGKSFSLVPWRPLLERHVGQRVSGVERQGSISWTFGRGRSAPDME